MNFILLQHKCSIQLSLRWLPWPTIIRVPIEIDRRLVSFGKIVFSFVSWRHGRYRKTLMPSEIPIRLLFRLSVKIGNDESCLCSILPNLINPIIVAC